MNLSFPILQLTAWLLALICSILGLYILLLNFRHTANRHVSGFMVLLALTNFAIGMIMGGTETSQAGTWPILLFAATAPAIGPYRVIITLILLKPQWLRGRLRWLWRAFYALTFLPALLTLSDAVLGTRLWWNGVDPNSFISGLERLPKYINGALSTPLLQLNCGVTTCIMAGVLIYIVVRRKQAKPLTYRLARLLLIGLIASGLIILASGTRGITLSAITITSAIFTGIYAYAAFRQMISGRQLQRGRLQPRLTALVLVTTVPILIAMVLFVTDRAGEIIQQRALDRIESTNRALETSVSMWLDLNANALQELVANRDIVSMDPERQKPLLETMEEAYPHMYLVSTTDRRGYNVARSDDQPLQDYRQELWQIGARNGALTLDVFVDSTGQPALAMSMPIQRETGTIDGVAMFASRLNDVAEEVRTSRVGETGVAFVIDGQNRIVAHTNPELSAELQDFDYYPPVRALRTGEQNPIVFTDDEGNRWWAYADELDNSWGVIVQQQESELTAAVRHFRQVSWPLLAVGTSMLLVMVALTIRQALRPIATLTDTATAIAAGDLSRTAPVVSDDELGTLARTFNSMTKQLRELIGGLEQRVAERTADLRRRSRYLETTATVAREAALELDPQRLLTRVVNLISEKFGFYHVGIFLLDSTEKWAVLQAASSEGGQRMLARGHRLRVGQTGIVGYVTARGEPRIVLEVEEDAVYFDNPDLPETHSEMALPLRARGEVIGALDVQSRLPRAFIEEDIDVMQTLADQVAMAISNAQLFQQMQDALRAERRAYGELSRKAWQRMLTAQSELGARYDPEGILTSDEQLRETMKRAVEEGRTASGEPDSTPTLSVPLKVRDQTIGVLNVQKPNAEHKWAEAEIEVLEALADQLAQALESARLYEDTQRRATREQLTREITDRMRRSPDIEEIVQTTVDELFSALGTSRTFVELRLTSTQDDGRDDR